MGELRDLMMGNYYDKFVLMTENQKGDDFYRKARTLSEDLVFLKILVRRNSASGFGFEITPMNSTMDFRFWHDLFHGSFCGHVEDDYIRKMLVDYYLVKNMFDFLTGETVESEKKWTMDVCKALKAYFVSMHGLKLEEYAGCFINCSSTCEEVISIIRDL